MRVKANYNNKGYVFNYKEAGKNNDETCDTLGDFIASLVQQIPELEEKINYNMIEIHFKHPFKRIEILNNLDCPIEEIGIKNGCQFWIIEGDEMKSHKELINGDELTNRVEKKRMNDDNGSDSTSIRELSSVNNGLATIEKQSNLVNDNDKRKKKSRTDNNEEDKFYAYSAVSQGCFKLRKMPDDNSCLFHSISFCIFGDANHETELRSLVCTRILQDPERFNEAYLGKKVSAYVDWIRKPSSWGGAIEIQIFSEYYEVEIHSVDIKSGRVDKFGDYDKFLVIFYSGVHFDTMSFKIDDLGKELGLFQDKEFDKRDVLQKAQDIREQLRNVRYYTDMSSATFICKACSRFIKGEKEMILHMNSYGHVDFEEVI